MPYLFGPYRTVRSRYTPAPGLSLGLSFGEAIFEPFEVEPVLKCLSRELSAELGKKVASRLSVHALSQGLEHKASRLSKTFLHRHEEIYRLALLTLEDTGAQPLGIDRLTLELGDLSLPAIQKSLWPKKERLELAIAAVEECYPRAILRVAPDNIYSNAPDEQMRLVVRSTGEEVTREAHDDSGQRYRERERTSMRA